MSTTQIPKLDMGRRLRLARQNIGLTQKDLADRVGIGSRNYSKYESGWTFPPPHVLARLCESLDVSSDYLLGLSDDYRSPETDRKGGDYICILDSDGTRHIHNIPEAKRDRVRALLEAGFPEIMDE